MISYESQVEQHFNEVLKGYGYHLAYKNLPLRADIDQALKNGESKVGGNGGNFPDAKFLVTLDELTIPVMVEYKGYLNRLVKLGKENLFVDNYVFKKEKAVRLSPHVNTYAVNGAIHYARAVLDQTQEIDYPFVLAVGATGGVDETGKLVYRTAVYVVSRENLGYEVEIASGPDLSCFDPRYFEDWLRTQKATGFLLNPQQKDYVEENVEYDLETALTGLNELLHGLGVNTSARVELVAGLIMASLGVKDGDSYSTYPLKVDDLKSGPREKPSRFDGAIVSRRVGEFLEDHGLPEDKIGFIMNRLDSVFKHSSLGEPRGDKESIIKEVYRYLDRELHTYYKSGLHLDFTGKLFQVMNAWVQVPDGADNDVVLTPRYVTDLMVKLTGVNRSSYVNDYTLGSGGFLVSAMKAMLLDVQSQKVSPRQKELWTQSILTDQLLGVEKLDNMYMLAILNMILMGDGSANILKGDSLSFDGRYEFGPRKGEIFPANVALLNPPYSAPGKGLIFLEQALNRMEGGGWGAILIQENAGAGQGGDYAKRLLQQHTLRASIHMADIFKGKASVRTAVYLFEAGRPHQKTDLVRFVNMEEDGYLRQNRKKSDARVNLKDDGTAKGRYQEVADLVLNGGYKNGEFQGYFYSKDDYIEDTITLNGDDWTFAKHQRIDTRPQEADFLETIGKYLEFQVAQVLEGRVSLDEGV